MRELIHIADIRTGYPFRKSPRRVEQDGWLLIQMKDIDAGGNLHPDRIERIEEPPDARHHQLKTGDVLMAARGSRNQATAFVESDDAAVPASHLMVIQPRESVLPEYLAWFLNLPETQERLAAMRVGSTIPFVSVQALAGLKVAVPSVEQQKRIVEVYRLWLKEEELMESVKRKRRELVDALLREVLTGQRK